MFWILNVFLTVMTSHRSQGTHTHRVKTMLQDSGCAITLQMGFPTTAHFSAWLLVRSGQPSPFWVGETAGKICRIPTASDLAFFADFFFSHCSFGKSWFMKGFPRGASGKEAACQCRRPKRLGFDPWVGKISSSRKWQSTPAFLPGKLHGWRNLAGYTVHGVAKNLSRLKQLSTHSTI